jgi:Flp pilus assembly protein TadG
METKVMRQSEQRRSGGQRGQALVEFALVATLLMLLFGGALDLGRVWYGSIGLESAAREGALEAAASPGSFVVGQPCDPATNRIMCRVIGEAAGSFVTIDPADVRVTCAPAACPAAPTWGDTVSVTVVGHFDLLTPFLAAITGPTLTVSASATAQRIVAP